MSDATAHPPTPVRLASASVFVATFAVVIATIALFLSLDLFLARIDQRESDAHAASESADGAALLARGRPADAADHFGIAAAIDRRNINYSLALAEAKLEEGHADEAETILRTLLERAENDGAVNLTMAHVMVRENRPEDAKAYLHRAMFGRWGADSVVRRTQARFELIDLIAKKGTSRELLAELLPLDEMPADSVQLRRRLGHWFILAGSPARAANIFRDLIHRDPRDADAYAGMGEAALMLGNFRTARADLAEALRLSADDAAITARLALVDSVIALDPSARGIGSAERYARSRAVLERTLASVGECDHGPASAAADSARRLLAMPAPRPRSPAETLDASADAMLSAAGDLWLGRPPACQTAGDDTLRLLLARISQ